MFDDKKSKVIPFAKRGTSRAGLDDTAADGADDRAKDAAKRQGFPDVFRCR
jgi:hypothetical protein